MPLYAAMSTLGSLAGCLVMYAIGRKGGDALLRGDSGAASQRAMAMFDRYGVLAVMVPAILPPPAPFKLFVILAGVVRISPRSSSSRSRLAVAFATSPKGCSRSGTESRRSSSCATHGREVSLWFGLVVLAAGLLYVFWRSRTNRPSAEAHRLKPWATRGAGVTRATAAICSRVCAAPSSRVRRHQAGCPRDGIRPGMTGGPGVAAAEQGVGKGDGHFLTGRVDNLDPKGLGQPGPAVRRARAARQPAFPARSSVCRKRGPTRGRAR